MVSDKMECHISDMPPDPDADFQEEEKYDEDYYKQLDKDIRRDYEREIAEDVKQALKDIFGTNQAE